MAEDCRKQQNSTHSENCHQVTKCPLFEVLRSIYTGQKKCKFLCSNNPMNERAPIVKNCLKIIQNYFYFIHGQNTESQNQQPPLMASICAKS